MMTVWRLRTGADKRIRSGHPWVFSNELSVSPKGHVPGAPVELQDAKGQFVARGYGNPHSLIAFRALTFNSQDAQPTGFDFLHQKVLGAWRVRKAAGFRGSFRLCFGESDYIPGLVLDYYLVDQNGKKAQVFVAQLVTAGMDTALQNAEEFFKGLVEKAKAQGFSDFTWEQTAVVIRNDVGIRKLEGMTVNEPKTIKDLEGFNLEHIEILLNAAGDDGVIKMSCDLKEGQKTGFFLDQTHNIYLAVNLFKSWAKQQNVKSVRVLDLCCYVGHWATQITRALKAQGLEVEVHLVDVSKTALAFAKENAEREGAKVVVHQMDVLEGLQNLPSQHYDIVIADPPAFIKAKKDIPTGKAAYIKMNTHAFRLGKKNGFVASCSCSGLLEEEEFRDAIRKASLRNYSEVRSVLRGGHAADHPTLMQFPEGFYLKMYVHYVM
ncbi:class I SAM-dependent rRNA methyltransferase [Bdellovibrio svalbardensis]|uniref:Methyltransferase domain-containing protein n=1 Tax=Bdellovibrio svalbardensis TaxID=2972972 RepID=A0ABT6DGT0_9BACT|nr:methyltransferase domain-containing protein [Bdellovibrio svalbardensis]MDG0815465.1 methyltransferase domain-containing protein [Bdellovibrio svalbardensis]